MKPDLIFETSWEVCNKVGGIHTVITTKSKTLQKKYDNKLIFIGPDILNDQQQNNEFIEDKSLYRAWKFQAENEGLRIKIGNWNIPGKPIVILVDFTTFISEKDKIFSKFWELYQLDSISGQWDYVESALFGYAAGKVIESFCISNMSAKNNIIAHFHEWMTGAGVLYIKNQAPYISTIFTTHATTLGRSISGNGQPLYDKLNEYISDSKAYELNVVSKQSLERIAANQADSLTTVSDITKLECLQFLHRAVDIVTPNGFEDSFIPSIKTFETKRKEGRKTLLNVASALLGEQLPEDVIITGISGRYEYKNKGIDVFIDSLSQLQNNNQLNKTIVAFFLIPANHHGPRKDLIDAMNNQNSSNALSFPFTTHYLNEIDYDPIISKIRSLNLQNSPDSKVKIIFAPTYLNGQDGIFNKSYYDLLIGMDLTVFPSYYEPWGYTPLESIAFKVPTITTTLAGFGQWALDNGIDFNTGVGVIKRNDNNAEAVSEEIKKHIISFASKTEEEHKSICDAAFLNSKKALWKHFIINYEKAYDIALTAATPRKKNIQEIRPADSKVYFETRKSNKPHLRKLFVQSKLSDRLSGLNELSKNIWYSWNYKAIELFESIDKDLWKRSGKNPISLLKQIPQERLSTLENDFDFIKRYDEVYKEFKNYMSEKPDSNQPKISYFSMEYGLNDNLKIFSGGLGILAGDYLKEASDSKINITAIGLLYKYGYFTQRMSLHGEQLSQLDQQKFSQLPLTAVRDEGGNLITIQLNLPGRKLHARIWRVDVGRIPLYLLDTDFKANNDSDRSITHQLYGGDWENRLKQEILLGLGGVRALEALNIDSDLYHCNEGHAALMNVERMANLTTKENFSFGEALEIVRSSALFTTHTPVPAGHDTFSEDFIRTYLRHMPERLNVDWEQFLSLGKHNVKDPNEKFSMSILAANTSQEMNGVSKLHGKVTQEMFAYLWDGFSPEELHIGYVTNGVHYPTWTAKEWKILHKETFGKDFISDLSNKEHWRKIYNVEDDKIWGIKNRLRKKLIDYIKIRFNKNWIKRYENPKNLIKILNKIDEKALTIGFARRFATYKRAHLLFTDLERLSRIVNNENMPVQFIFAGKAHPADKAGQDMIKSIIEISRRPEFVGKILFLENYDIELAKRLVKGVDIWLNTPTRPLEASGTSGQKAELNGTLNFSVLDGWWVEGYKKDAGWALTEKRTYDNQDYQDQLDAQTIYSIFENEIIPLYYKRNENGIPVEWIQFIKKSIAEIAPEFTTKRMIDDYNEKYYQKLYKRTLVLRDNDYKKAIELSLWKKRIARNWDSIDVVSIDFPSTTKKMYIYGEKYRGEVILDLNGLIEEEICVEMVISNAMEENTNQNLLEVKRLKLDKKVDTMAFYKIEIELTNPGIFDYGLRIFACHPNLPNKQDFNYVRWI